VFVDDWSEVLDPSTCLCELLNTAVLQVCSVSVLIPSESARRKYVVSIHTEGASAFLASPWVLHKGLAANLIAYAKTTNHPMPEHVKRRLSHEMRERLSFASEALVRSSPSLAIMHEFPELFSTDMRRFAFEMKNLALPRRLEVWQREYRTFAIYPVPFGRIYLPVSLDEEPAKVAMKRYCSDFMGNAVNVHLAYPGMTQDCTTGILATYANTLYGSVIDSVARMPLPYLPSSTYTELGVLFARSIYHAAPLRLEVNDYFFELMFYDKLCLESILTSYKPM
jgi:hypothetical protein